MIAARAIVIRAAFLLTFALTLAGGDSVTLVCRALCDRTAPAGAEMCHHTESAAQPTITTNADCNAVGLPSTAIISNEAHRPGLSIPDAATAVSVAITPAATASAHAFAPGGASPTPGIEPRTIALRI